MSIAKPKANCRHCKRVFTPRAQWPCKVCQKRIRLGCRQRDEHGKIHSC